MLGGLYGKCSLSGGVCSFFFLTFTSLKSPSASGNRAHLKNASSGFEKTSNYISKNLLIFR